MNFSLADILHTIGQVILTPCMIVLIFLMVTAVWQTGDLIVEYFTERRKTKIDVPALLKQISESSTHELKEVIGRSSLPLRQKEEVYVLIESAGMPRASLTAVAQRLLTTEEERYQKAVEVTDLVAKLGPMFGLLGTLIPLGPGIVALGQGDTSTLSNSLGIAFDTTIAGVIAAAVALVISCMRKRWYNGYMVSMESIMECILEEVASDAEK
ncbi:MotA/TolQ/ExbB proton channel family protein [Bacilliculturomica massiliensis]|uniref:MotA/TolQ/ExbB proton channel family protein n=1 Tax=Bacilliculturomica massiliensis TaxID=1917867 RepID=UPI0010304C68|nr:MotA/TolQ/ExbB proton channel family protein [Bacilliculturomica massiliensis]